MFHFLTVDISSIQVTLRTEDMDLAGDVIQALCVFLNIEDLQVTADFPTEMDILKDILIKVKIVLPSLPDVKILLV